MFDPTGHSLRCGAGTCGDPEASDTFVQLSRQGVVDDADPPEKRYPLGVARRRNKAGIYSLRSFDERGRQLLRVEAVPSSAQAPALVLDGVVIDDGESTDLPFALRLPVSVSVENGFARSMERTYYTPGGRTWVRARAALRLGTAALPLGVPEHGDPSTGWFDDSGDPAAVVSLPFGGSASVGVPFDVDLFPVWVLDDGDAIVGQYLPAFDDVGLRPRRLLRCNVQVRADLDAVGQRSVRRRCTEIDAQGRTVARWNLGSAKASERGQTFISRVRHVYEDSADAGPIACGEPRRCVGRLQRSVAVSGFAPGGGAVERVTWQTCQVDAYDELGRSDCSEIPHPTATDPGSVSRTQTLVSVLADGSRREATAQGSESEIVLRTYSITLASGFVVEQGVIDGNRVNHYVDDFASMSATGVPPATVGLTARSVVQFNAISTPLWTTRTDHDPQTGFVTETRVTDEIGLARISTFEDRVGGDDLPQTETRGDSATTTKTYNDFDAVEQLTEPDGQVVVNRYGQALASTAQQVADAARLVGVERQGLGTVIEVASYHYDPDGRVVEIDNGLFPVADYHYDGFGQVIEEVQHVTGATHRRLYDDAGREIRHTIEDGGGIIVSMIDSLYDPEGRLLLRCRMAVPEDGSEPACNDEDIEVFYQYDTKAPYVPAGTEVELVVGGRTVRLSDDFQSGRVAFVEDRHGATFFEYDAVGRVVAVVRHDGALGAALDPAQLSVTGYEYGPAGELLFIEYPSGKRVEYVYCTDKERPCAVRLHDDGDVTDVATGIRWEPGGQPRLWRWGDGASIALHSIDRDSQGFIKRIYDVFGGETVSDVRWDYDGEGDPIRELDASPSHPQHLAAEQPALQPPLGFSYDNARDYLDGWALDFGAEGVVWLNQLGYDAAGRRVSELRRDGEFSEDTLTEPIDVDYAYFDTTAPELLMEKTRSFDDVEELTVVAADAIGRMTDIQLPVGVDPAARIELMYGPEGNTEAVTLDGVGVWENRWDHEMRRTDKRGPLEIMSPGGTTTFAGTTFRYGLGADVLEERETEIVDGQATTFLQDEHVYLAGQRIAVRHTDSEGANAFYYALTDRMGVVRKVVRPDGEVVARVLLDPFGAARVVPAPETDRSLPALRDRYPGQYADDEVGVVNNRWRTYLPPVGMYTSGDAKHRTSLRANRGPQAYSYGASRPLFYVDRDGRLAVDYASLENCPGSCAARDAWEQRVRFAELRLNFRWPSSATPFGCASNSRRIRS